MITGAKLALFFAFAFAADAFSIFYHDARERRRIWAISSLSAILGILNWVPMWFAFTDRDWRIAVIDVVGSSIGAAWAVHRLEGGDDA